MVTSANSYAFDQFQTLSKQQEITRLNRKTTILQAIDHHAQIQADIQAGMTILDLGCGSGSLTQELAQIAYPGHTVGIDSSVEMIAHASSQQMIETISFQVGDAYDLNFPEATFDIVYARFLFQHLTVPFKALDNIYRVLKPGGTLCVVDVDDDWFTLYPEPNSFKEFRKQVVEIQQLEGGDPYVGRKLYSYFNKIGLKNIKSSVQILGQHDYGTDTLISLLSFGVPYHATYPSFVQIADQAKEDIYQLMTEEDLWASFGLFVATGCKPK